MKKEIPMLYSRPMVQAIIRETNPKTETRRTRGLDFINENPDNYEYLEVGGGEGVFHVFLDKPNNMKTLVKCPYGKVGDFIWVRETWMEMAIKGIYNYKVNHPTFISNKAKEEVLKDAGFKWKPSIHMPKVAARIWLEITEITAERLNNITNDGALAEGIEISYCKDNVSNKTLLLTKNYINDKMIWMIPTLSYKTLWESINGIGSWDKNPWVWVIKFKKINK